MVKIIFLKKKDFWELFLEHIFLYLEPKNDHCTLEFLLHCYGASLNFISQTLHGTPEQHQGPKMATYLGMHSISTFLPSRSQRKRPLLFNLVKPYDPY